jgi:hypothetical protein
MPVGTVDERKGSLLPSAMDLPHSRRVSEFEDSMVVDGGRGGSSDKLKQQISLQTRGWLASPSHPIP